MFCASAIVSQNVTAGASVIATLMLKGATLNITGASTLAGITGTTLALSGDASALSLSISGNSVAQAGIAVPNLPAAATRFYHSVWAGHTTIASGGLVGLFSGTTSQTQAVIPLKVPREGTVTRVEITWRPQGTAALGTVNFQVQSQTHSNGNITNLASASVASVAGNSSTQTTVLTFSYAMLVTSDETLFVQGFGSAWNIAFQSVCSTVVHGAIREGVRG
jgi:hypothetical protein